FTTIEVMLIANQEGRAGPRHDLRFLFLSPEAARAATSTPGRDSIMSGERIPITREGYEKRKAELDQLTNVEMPAVAARIAAAREMGDLRENAEYHAAREAQGMLQAKIDYLKDQLSRAFIIDTNDIPKDQVAFGAVVRVRDMDLDEEEIFHLVGPGEDD